MKYENGISKDSSYLLKAFSISMIIIHNFFHQLPGVKENEFTYSFSNFKALILAIQNDPTNIVQGVLSYFGHYGVNNFIFISAYGLYMAHSSITFSDYTSKLKKRIIRLYRPFFLSILAWLVFILLTTGPYNLIGTIRYTFSQLFLTIIGLSPFFKGMELGLNGPWWYIPFTVWLYIFFPFLKLLFEKFGNKFLIILILISCLFQNVSLFSGAMFTPLGHFQEIALGFFLASRKSFRLDKKIIVILFLYIILGNYSQFTWSMIGIPVVIVSLALIEQINRLFSKKIKSYLKTLGENSMYFFLVNSFLRAPFLKISGKYSSSILDMALVIIFFISVIIVGLLVKRLESYLIRVDKNLLIKGMSFSREKLHFLPFLISLIFLGFSKILEYVSFGFTAFSPFYILHQTSLLLFVMCIFRLNHKKFIILFSPILVFELLSLGHFYIFKLPITEGGLSALFTSNLGEWLDYSKGASFKIVFVFIGLILIFISNFLTPKSIKLPIKIAPLLLLPTLGTYVLKLINQSSHEKAYYSTIEGSRPYRSISIISKTISGVLEYGKIDFFNNYKPIDLVKRNPIKGLHVVVIGETSRRKNWQVYGYKRKTNPKLSKESEIVFFDDAISSSNSTLNSLMDLFLFRDKEGNVKNDLVSLLSKNEIKVWWISNQAKHSALDAPISKVGQQALESVFINTDLLARSHDEKLLKYFDNLVSEKKDGVIFLHTMGSHGEYHLRYPEAFKVFVGGKDKGEDYKNNYDNTIVYTDYFLSKIMEKTKKSTHIKSVTYFSDHGETIYENNVPFPTHGGPTVSRRELDIPMFFWVSDQEIQKTLEAKKSAPYFLPNLKYDLLWIIGFETVNIKKSLFNGFNTVIPRKVYGSNKDVINYNDLPIE